MDNSRVTPKRPLPVPPPESLPFWQAAHQRRLTFPRCDACGKSWFPPANLCPHCLSDGFHWEEACGRGKVFSFVVVHRVYHGYFANKVPYTVAVVELDEGPRILSNIVGVDPQKVHCNMAVQVAFDEAGPDMTLPLFAPVEAVRKS